MHESLDNRMQVEWRLISYIGKCGLSMSGLLISVKMSIQNMPSFNVQEAAVDFERISATIYSNKQVRENQL